jgi:replication factor A1
MIPGTFGDFIGIVIKFDPIDSITTKEGQLLIRRRIEIGDQSGYSVDLMIWNEETTNFPENERDIVISIKFAKIVDFRRKSIATTMFSILTFNPYLDQALQLRNWFRSKTQIFHKLSIDNSCPTYFLNQIDQKEKSQSENSVYFFSDVILADVDLTKNYFMKHVQIQVVNVIP